MNTSDVNKFWASCGIKMARKIAWTRTQDLDLHADLVQESYLAVVSNWSKIRNVEKPSPYAWKCIRGAQVDYLVAARSPVSGYREAISTYVAKVVPIEDIPTLEQALGSTYQDTRSPWVLVRRHCAYKRRMVLWKLYYRGHTPAEVAEQMGISIDSVHSLRKHGIQNILDRSRPKVDYGSLARKHGYPTLSDMAKALGSTVGALRCRLKTNPNLKGNKGLDTIAEIQNLGYKTYSDIAKAYGMSYDSARNKWVKGWRPERKRS
jgi:RNA polymerase sigma factor (sigma-70 family)